MQEKATVLVVDDEPTNIAILAEILADDYEVKVALNGEDALQIINSDEQPDLVLLDIVMPGMDGYEVAKNIVSNEKISHIPFIFLTAKQSDENVVKGLLEGAADYISKPFSNEVLLARVNTHVQLAILRKELMNALKQRERDLDIIDQYILVLHLDRQGLIVNASQAFLELSGYGLEELVAKRCTIYSAPIIPVDVYNELYSAIASGEVWKGELENKKKDGETFWMDVTISPEYDSKGNRTGYIALANDITSRKYIEKLSETDHLTQLYNRKKIEKVLETECERAARYGGMFSVIMADIDHFKSVNDTFGHQIGDEVLVGVATLFKESVRKTDSVGRLGGEEFLIICPETSRVQAIEVAEKLRQGVMNLDFKDVGQKTVSLGVSTYGEHDNAETLIKRADDALYEAKETGRNKVVSL